MLKQDITEKEKTDPPKVPLYAQLAFPIGNILALMGIEHKDTVLEPEPALPVSDFTGHVYACTAALRAFTLAYIAIYWVHGGEDGYGYPAYSRAAEWNVEWMWPIVVRNLIAMWVVCGTWDYILQYSILAPYFAPFKLDSEYPTFK